MLVQIIDERGRSRVPDSNSLIPRSGGQKRSVRRKAAPQHPTRVFSERGNVFAGFCVPQRGRLIGGTGAQDPAIWVVPTEAGDWRARTLQGVRG